MVTLTNVKTLFLIINHHHSRCVCLFLSEAIPNVTYLFYHAKPAPASLTDEVAMPSLKSLCTDWYLLKVFENCANIRHVKQLNRSYGFDRFARVRMKEIQSDITAPSGIIHPFWKNLKIFAFEFRRGSEFSETLDEIKSDLNALLMHNGAIQVISGVFYDTAGGNMTNDEKKMIEAQFKCDDCSWYENHPSLSYFKMGFNVLVMKFIDEELELLINQMDYRWPRYGWDIRCRSS